MILYFLHKGMKRLTGVRYDSTALLPYHHASTFSVKEERFSFLSKKRRLYGSRYYVDNNPKAIIMFFHGLGDGRASYVKEISLLAQQGYWVFAYDNTGCNESEGTMIGSMGVTVQNQRDFFKYLDSIDEIRDLPRYAIGHSWGGYGALISAKPQYKISKIVAISGYLNFYLLFASQIKNPLLKALARPSMRLYEGNDSLLDARDIIRNSEAKVLYIGGEKDKTVSPELSYDLLKNEFGDNDRFSFIQIKGSGHSPWRTLEAQEYVHGLLHKGIMDPFKNVSDEMNLNKATEENEEVMNSIFDFFAS